MPKVAESPALGSRIRPIRSGHRRDDLSYALVNVFKRTTMCPLFTNKALGTLGMIVHPDLSAGCLSSVQLAHAFCLEPQNARHLDNSSNS